jgi:hypothetical protein
LAVGAAFAVKRMVNPIQNHCANCLRIPRVCPQNPLHVSRQINQLRAILFGAIIRLRAK